MSMFLDQQVSFKYFCRICKKGFGCGRALGGHMRAHGIGDESMHIDEEDPASDWEEKNGSQGNKRMYALRTNPNRLKSCRVCENCGKEFLSWKAFLEHGKCTSDNFVVDDLRMSVSPGSKDDSGNGKRGECGGGGGWSKGKRSKRAKVGNNNNSNSNCPSSEEEDLVNCLVMLSAARVDPLVAETEESCASASREEDRRYPMSLMLAPSFNRVSSEKGKGVSKWMFECKACKKVFNSHQALGGHRASHKKIKGCFASKLDDLDDSIIEEEVITHGDFFITSKQKLKSIDVLPLDHVADLQLAIPLKS
ncbi:hypothetical protein GIB67_036491 [Kingdonia uniflora]|uniref:C2H2-type domain-containing protein n=1 Tax=Kingdonia uniflora TaxID=39325 RepID=A0A7J7P7U1_9MAGN|nr:hypothetical protein GIB67_036491 [Kingdonia uniflora]